MQSSLPKAVRNGKSNILHLGSVIGKGGEGSVFNIIGDSTSVAKIYTQPLVEDRIRKLQTMVKLGTPRLEHVSSWPTDVLRDAGSDLVIGLLMPNVASRYPIHSLYSPKTRTQTFPWADYRFVVNAAANIARAFNVVHRHGIVIGDVNENNIRISDAGTAMIIDCDSFQITTSDDRFLCEVGVATHTPPELQGSRFAATERTTNHDEFGLAVIIFQLLFMGRHPFAGRYQGAGEMPISRAISELRFAYNSDAARVRMKPPPNVLPVDSVTSQVFSYFERAFGEAGVKPSGRPRSAEWVAALDDMNKELRRCSLNPSHFYLQSLRNCPWCSLENKTHFTFFRETVILTTKTGARFKLTAAWEEIAAIKSPGSPQTLPDKASLGLQPDPLIVTYAARARKIRVVIASCTLALAFCLFLFVGSSPAGILIAAGLIMTALVPDPWTWRMRARRKVALSAAKERYTPILARWDNDASDHRFTDQLQRLVARRREYESLETQRQTRMNELLAQRRQQQLQSFLDRHVIANYQITLIGPERKSVLRSHGIVTCADVSKLSILAIPGFGDRLSQELLNWRHSVERRFVFDRKVGIDPAAVRSIDNEFARKRVPAEEELRLGAHTLQVVRNDILLSRTDLWPILQSSYVDFVKAEVDLHALPMFGLI